MTSKHRLYQHIFLENLNRHPMTRITILFLALDIEKFIMVKQHNGVSSLSLETFNSRLNPIISCISESQLIVGGQVVGISN